ncbi:MAG: DUF4303 domain-containing protein [Nannocystales bacterium]
MTERARFDELVFDGLVRARDVFLQRNVGSDIAGVALCTDDELGTLYCMMVTVDQIQGSADPDLLFTPVDWPCDEEMEPFTEANANMRGALENLYARFPDEDTGDEEFLQHVDSCFDGLVLALKRARAEDLFPKGAFLSVLSTDPSEYLLKLWSGSISTLNEPGTVRLWNTFLRKWS